MNCPYCGSQNNSEDHRCGRCGRRLPDRREDVQAQKKGLPQEAFPVTNLRLGLEALGLPVRIDRLGLRRE